MNKQWYKQDLCKVSFNSCALSIFWPKIIIYCPSCWKGDTVAFAAGNATRSIGPFLRQVNHTIVRTCGLTAARHNKYTIHLHQRGGIGAATAGWVPNHLKHLHWPHCQYRYRQKWFLVHPGNKHMGCNRVVKVKVKSILDRLHSEHVLQLECRRRSNLPHSSMLSFSAFLNIKINIFCFIDRVCVDLALALRPRPRVFHHLT